MLNNYHALFDELGDGVMSYLILQSLSIHNHCYV
jgi:hypothetical protein